MRFLSTMWAQNPTKAIYILYISLSLSLSLRELSKHEGRANRFHKRVGVQLLLGCVSCTLEELHEKLLVI